MDSNLSYHALKWTQNASFWGKNNKISGKGAQPLFRPHSHWRGRHSLSNLTPRRLRHRDTRAFGARQLAFPTSKTLRHLWLSGLGGRTRSIECPAIFRRHARRQPMLKKWRVWPPDQRVMETTPSSQSHALVLPDQQTRRIAIKQARSYIKIEEITYKK